MPYTISNNSCAGCDKCRFQCPTGAIKIDNGEYWIDPHLCNNCEGYYSEPQCASACPSKSPMPLQVKKGRCKIDDRELTSSDLFFNGKSNPFASGIPIWEACNVLSQRTSLPWVIDDNSQIFYSKQINQGKGKIAFHINSSSEECGFAKDLEAIEALDIRAACVHLIFAAYATFAEKPWEEEFVIDDKQIEKYLGLEKRKDLNKTTKLALMKSLVLQASSLMLSIDLPEQGRIKPISLEKTKLWDLLGIQHHFQHDELGCKYLIGLTFRVQAGDWAKYFLNKEACKERTAFYQYGNLPKSLLTTVMSIWQQHEGAARLMMWLMFKAKMGKQQRITIPTLMRVAYGDRKVAIACRKREERKRLLRTYESDLETLSHHGMKPIFDPVTYPEPIQPLWSKLADIPEDPDEAIEFWINDGDEGRRLTDVSPRGKWKMLMNARILAFEMAPKWDQPNLKARKKQQRTKSTNKRRNIKTAGGLLGEQIRLARKNLSISQRELARLMGKSQSWIRDIENGRLKVKIEDQLVLRKVLKIA